ncbi:sodium/glutamate symporter [Gordonia polyisoprenivorans NBRC 16320 = JCM 10675]|uniref:Sodium:glutamate symporter n=1 Tax=Gordonia polyisoprenivorans TaxID=84595 RepID=A0A846WLH0_9ACTN|nr:sodium/glutamate symporter [Gordonia polyisoprenivorans]NKY01856.1 sodium:glutamate symporter [Gordonia polyisoprenivorans]GAB25079.1 sodium/glutamate symporter [Gordonia polyisoprenivorans NBRC 16320 = JCM 10675]
MLAQLSEAQTVGLSLAILGAVLVVGWTVRMKVGFLHTLFIPASVVSGFLVLILGPQVLGRLTDSHGLFPSDVIEVWRVIPGLMINVVFAAIMLGKTLPSPRALWDAAAPHALFGAFLSFGQFALGGLAVLLVLTPFFGLPAEAGSLLEMSFAGGHGTIAGMGQVFSDEGAPELVDIGLGLATISMVTGVVVGSMLVRWAVRHPRIPLRRNEPLRSDENYDVDDIHVVPADAKPANETGLHPTTLAFALIGVTILVSVGILWGARAIVSALGSDILDKMPLFPVAVIGGFIVQWVVTRTGQAHRVDKRAIEGISSIALDVLLVCAIGTMSLATIGSNVPAIVVFTVVGVGWSVVCLIWLGRRFHGADWFEHAIADFGQSQGNVATGFVLADMVDPRRETSTANAYGYKQLPYEPFLGGGLITALSVPLIVAIGLPWFTAVSVVAVAVIGVWGMRRRKSGVGG